MEFSGIYYYGQYAYQYGQRHKLALNVPKHGPHHQKPIFHNQLIFLGNMNLYRAATLALY